MTSESPLYINEGNLILFDRVRAASTGAYFNAGTATWQLKDADDVLVASGSLVYVTASNGRWTGIIDRTDLDPNAIADGDVLYLEVTISGGGSDGFRRLQLVATWHEEDP